MRVGTAGPYTRLTVSGTRTQGSNMDAPNADIIDTSTAALGVGGRLGLGGAYNSSAAMAGFAAIEGGKENATDGNYASYLAFGTRANGGSITEKVRVNSTGMVGIGTTNRGHCLI